MALQAPAHNPKSPPGRRVPRRIALVALQTPVHREAVEPTRHLPRSLGLSGAIGLGVGSTLGGAIFALAGIAVGEAGPAVLLSFALALIATLFVALPYVELACYYPQAGGVYAFVRQTLGDQWGFVVGWIYVTSYLGVAAYVGLGFGNYLHTLCMLPPLVGALLLFTAVTLFNLCGGHLVDRLLKLIVLLTFVSLLGFSLGGLPHLDPRLLTPVFPHGLGGVMNAAPIAFLALSGFDVLAAAGEEVQHPQRTLPLAIFSTVGMVFGLYVLICITLVGLLPAPVLASSPTPLADAAALIFGGPGRWLIACAALLANAARGNAILVASSRATFAMARDGLFPGFLAQTSARGIPYAAIVLNGLLFLVIVLFGSLTWAALLANTLYALQFFFAFATLLVLRRRQTRRPAVFRTPALAFILPLAVASCLCMLLAGGLPAVAIAGLWLGIGWLFGILARKAAVWQKGRRSCDQSLESLPSGKHRLLDVRGETSIGEV